MCAAQHRLRTRSALTVACLAFATTLAFVLLPCTKVTNCFHSGLSQGLACRGTGASNALIEGFKCLLID